MCGRGNKLGLGSDSEDMLVFENFEREIMRRKIRLRKLSEKSGVED